MMLDKNQQQNNSKLTDKVDSFIYVVSAIGLIVCAAPLLSENVYRSIFSNQNSSESVLMPTIGQITFAENDIRHKSKDSIAWDKTKARQIIRVGDSLFTGEKSQSQVRLNDGGTVSLDQKSLVTFSKIDSIEMPNLSSGNFRVAVNGKMKVVINGEVSEITGTGSEVQVTIVKNEKPKIKLLKGTASISQAKKQITLSKQKITVLAEPVKKQQEVVVEIAKSTVSIVHDNENLHLTYYDKISDLYNNENGILKSKLERRRFVDFSIPVQWKSTGLVSQVYGSLSDSKSFENTGDSFVVAASEKTADFKKAYLGENYYRLSTDGKTWGETQLVEIVAHSLKIDPPMLATNSSDVYILEQSAVIDVRPYVKNTDYGIDGIIYEISNSHQFAENETHRFLRKFEPLQMPVRDAQTIYIRARGVDKNEHLTDFSKIYKINVAKPDLPLAPVLAKNKFTTFVNEELPLNWGKSNNASTYEITIIDSKGKIINSQSVGSNKIIFKNPVVDHYKVIIQSADSFGRKSVNKFTANVDVVELPKPVLAKQEKVEEKIEEKPVESLSTTVAKSKYENKKEIPEYLNRNFSQSKVFLEGAGVTGYSQDQLQQGKTNPSAFTLGIRAQHWLGIPHYTDNGFEVAYKTKMADATDNSATGFSPTQFEGRYLFRWNLNVNPLSDIKRSELMWIMGYENYNNPSSKLFSPKYDLMKTGFGLALPLSRKWDGGGDVLYGYGTDRSQKYEVSGYFSYFLQKQWSFGMGYRVHLFEAGSNATAPIAAPYREGIGEGYSVLRWIY
jgi:hypothetical protein